MKGKMRQLNLEQMHWAKGEDEQDLKWLAWLISKT